MKSVISNTSDSGCGERAGEAVSGETAATPVESARGREGKTLTSLSAAILRRCRDSAPSPWAQRLTGKRRSAVRAVPPRRRLTGRSDRAPSRSLPVPRAAFLAALRGQGQPDGPPGLKCLTVATQEAPAGAVTSRRCEAEGRSQGAAGSLRDSPRG